MKSFFRIGYWITGFCIGCWLVMVSCSIDKTPFDIEHITEPFDTLSLYAVFDVVLQQGDHFGIEISGVSEVAESITYQIANRTLRIDNNDGALWKHPELEPPVLTITFQRLSKINAYETCNIKTKDTIRMDSLGLTLGGKLNIADLQIDCHLFYYWNASPVGGQLTVSGRTDYVRFYNGSLMAIRAENLIAHDALVANGSPSDVHVFTDQNLYYSITGIGNIYLQGNPPSIEAGLVTSTGRLIQ